MLQISGDELTSVLGLVPVQTNLMSQGEISVQEAQVTAVVDERIDNDNIDNNNNSLLRQS